MTDTEKYSLGNVAWGFPAANLCHAKAETSQPTPTEQLRAIAQAETAFNTCGKIDRMVIHGQLVAAQSNADFPAILAHVEALQAERDELRLAASSLAEEAAWLTNIDRIPGIQLSVRQLTEVNNAIRHMRKTLAAKAGGK